MNKNILLLAVACALPACDKGVNAKNSGSGKNEAPSAVQATPSVASVLLMEDCPDPAPKPAEEAKSASRSVTEGEDEGDMDVGSMSGDYRQPCTQSTIQLAFAGQGAKPGKVRIKAIRLRSADGKPLASVEHRLPTIWKDGKYVPWDQLLPASSDQKASYKLRPPDWSAVETKLGSGSYGKMFMLEVDIDISGTSSTIRSQQFEREQPDIVET